MINQERLITLAKVFDPHQAFSGCYVNENVDDVVNAAITIVGRENMPRVRIFYLPPLPSDTRTVVGWTYTPSIEGEIE